MPIKRNVENLILIFGIPLFIFLLCLIIPYLEDANAIYLIPMLHITWNGLILFIVIFILFISYLGNYFACRAEAKQLLTQLIKQRLEDYGSDS